MLHYGSLFILICCLNYAYTLIFETTEKTNKRPGMVEFNNWNPVKYILSIISVLCLHPMVNKKLRKKIVEKTKFNVTLGQRLDIVLFT